MAHTITEEEYEKKIKKRLEEIEKKNLNFIERQHKKIKSNY